MIFISNGLVAVAALHFTSVFFKAALEKHSLLDKYLPTTICPAAKFKVTFLVIKRKPCNINLACAFKNSRRDVEAVACMWNYNIGLVCAIKLFISTEKQRSFVEIFLPTSNLKSYTLGPKHIWKVGHFNFEIAWTGKTTTLQI